MVRDARVIGLLGIVLLSAPALLAVSPEQPTTTGPTQRGSPAVLQPSQPPQTGTPTSPADESSEPAQAYALPRWTIDGGGGVSAGGTFGLTATIGQPEGEALAAAAFVLAGGFWSDGSAQPTGLVFSDGFETGDMARWSAVSSGKAPGSASPGREGGA